MIVHITFQPPSRPDGPDSPSVHERTLEGVPRAIAEEMVEDLNTYKGQSFEGHSSDGDTSSASQWKVYRYQKLGEEHLGTVTVPLDYGEVVDVAIKKAPKDGLGGKVRIGP